MKFIICILLVFTFEKGYPQVGKQLYYDFRHIDQNDGLIDNIIFCITQDKKGFIWVGTQNGLQRYDGNTFQTFRKEFIDKTESHARINELFVDADNHLWMIVNSNSIIKYDPTENKFINYGIELSGKKFLFDSEKFYDTKNHEWLVGNYGVYNYDTSGKNLKLHQFLFPLATNTGNRLIYDSLHQQFWYTAFSGIQLFDVPSKKTYVKNDTYSHALFSKFNTKEIHSSINKMMRDSKNNLWFYTWGGDLFKYNLSDQKIKSYSLAAIRKGQGFKTSFDGILGALCIYEDNHQNVWIGTRSSGLLRYNQISDKFDYIISDPNNSESIQYNFEILSIFQDKQDNLWIGTDKGISIFNPYHQNFVTLRHQKDNKSFPPNEINAIVEMDNMNTLVATWGGGLSEYDSNLQFKRNIFFKGIDQHNMIWCLQKNEDGKIWIGCQHGYLHIYDAVTQKKNTINPPEFKKSTVRIMAMDKIGNIYFGLHNGEVAQWNKNQKKMIAYNFGKEYPPLNNGYINHIFIDRQQNIWVSSENGFFEFDPVTMNFKKVYLPENNSRGAISVNSSRGIEQLNDSIIIIGTINGGLNFFNTISKEFTRWPGDGTSLYNTIIAIKKDIYGNIWLTTEYGLYSFNEENKTRITSYNFDKGIINSAFAANQFYSLSSGRWLTNTSTEIITFDPVKMLQQNEKSFPVEITSFKIFEKPLFINGLIDNKQPLQLSYLQNFITIEFSSLNFSQLQHPKYYYQLTGVDKNWVNAGSRHFAGYTNLEPGKYIFKVKSITGNKESEVTSFEIIISPPFWQLLWFNLACLGAIGLIIYYLVMRRIKTIRYESGLKQKIAETEMAALRAQMNPHFIFNCINAIDNLIQTNQKDKATTYLARFAKLIRNVLDSSKNNIVPFHKDLEAIKLFIDLEQFRCSNKFQYTINADEELLNGDYKVPPLLIQPFIENAIHHGLLNKQGADKQLSVTIEIKNENIIYTILDNGVGREMAEMLNQINKPEHVSYGIRISKERLGIYNKSLNVDSIIITDLFENNNPSGTKVEVKIKSDENN